MSAKSEGSGQATGFSSPQEEALINLMRTADGLQHSMQQRLKPSGLTITQFNVLRMLRTARPGGLTCSAIGRMMVTSVPDVTRLLGRLKTQQLLCQQRDPKDHRVIWNHITAQGLKELASLDGLVERAPQDLLGHLTREEIRELTRLLKKARSGASQSALPRNSVESFLA